MATQAKQPAAPAQHGIVRIRTHRSFGSGGKVQMTSHGCNCFGPPAKGIKVKDCVTTVEGLGENLKHDLIVADLKKKLRCKGGTGQNGEAGVVIRLHTERANEVKEFLWKSGLAEERMILCTPCV